VPLIAAVRQVFAPDGPLVRDLPGFVPRAGQTDMALAVARTVQGGGALVVEAGTGVGKTFAYLAPTLLSGARVLVSTATKALQDQLFLRDIPRLAASLGVPVRLAQLKGRSSYLCLQRLDDAFAGGTAAHLSAAQQRLLGEVRLWAQRTSSGDVAELPALDEASPLLPLITSTRDNCLGTSCVRAAQCHVNIARRTALAADVVVVNHHLFFADLQVRESGVAELLPSASVVVFDEAHQINAVGLQFLAVQTGTAAWKRLAADLLRQAQGPQRGFADWHGLSGALSQSVQAVAALFGEPTNPQRLPWVGGAPEGVDSLTWVAALGRVTAALEAARTCLDLLADADASMPLLSQRAQTLHQQVAGFAGAAPNGMVQWVEVGPPVRLCASPLNISAVMRQHVAMTDHASRAWIFTSATLGTDDALRWFVEPCGLEGARTLRVESPFDYARQAALYVPQDFPEPAHPDHSAAVAALVAEAAMHIGGKTLVLTTTLRAVQAVRKEAGRLDILAQGDASKRELLERFTAQALPPGPGAVLVASASFWEGIDLAGDVLQLLVIDKLPFAPPDDPLVRAQTEACTAAGGKAFKDIHLPHAAMVLKQGSGRLIRGESDRGILVVCDTRLHTRAYGKKLLQALPPMRRLHDVTDWKNALAGLAAPCATAAPPPAT
jgi:ATP-dependent DNA helicase DinG